MKNQRFENKRFKREVSFETLVKSVAIVAESLRLSTKLKILMYKKLFKDLGQPTDFLNVDLHEYCGIDKLLSDINLKGEI